MNMQSQDLAILQKEVFHRVSNNFQIVQSMIRLVCRDPSVKDIAAELEERIQLLSIAHHAQHSLEDARFHPVDQAMANAIAGMRRGGFLIGRDVTCDVSCRTMSIQRAYALLHIVVEVLRVLDRSAARKIDVVLRDDRLEIRSDAPSLALNQSTKLLASAFARDVGRDPVWSENGLTLDFG